ncbi:MAG: hypothetical protein Q4A70_01495 [Candidatus Saccharibacteria bacterium]|nr:hypothetical protein [Candidatus Saccharibacteria bacterium]
MRKFLLSLMLVAISLFVVATPVLAAEQKCVITSVVGTDKCDQDGTKNEKGEYNCSCDDGNGSGVTDILNLVVDIMTIGIGILGLIGISIVGIQYLTSGGNEEKAKKAKRRMFEIIIGLVAYVLLYAVLKWLLPGFN